MEHTSCRKERSRRVFRSVKYVNSHGGCGGFMLPTYVVTSSNLAAMTK